MKNWKQLSSAALILAPLTGWCDESLVAAINTSQKNNLDQRLQNLEEQAKKNCFVGCRPEKGIDLFAYADLLIWKIHEELPLAFRVKNPVTGEFPNYTQLLRDGKARNMNFHWDVGSRVGLGYHTPHEKLDLSLTWLRYFTKAHRHLHESGEYQLQATQLDPIASALAITPGSGQTEPAFLHVKGSWYAHLNQLDLDLARPFCIGSWFGVRPHFGIRTTWLRQRLSVSYLDNPNIFSCCGSFPGNYIVHKNCSWWGIGPEAGVDLNFVLGKGFSLFGNAAGAIEWGFHKTHDKEINLAAIDAGFYSPTVVNVRDFYRMSHPILDLLLGFRWEHMWDRLHFELDAGWEYHIYFSQNRFPYFVSSLATGKFTDENGDKTFGGWTLSARFDF
jgi:hypothetical protein